MKKFTKTTVNTIIVLFILGFSSSVMAAEYGNWAKIEEVMQWNGDTSYSYFVTTEDASAATAQGCSKSDYSVLEREDSSSRIYSLILSAFIANKEVRFLYDGCSSDDRPQFKAIKVR